MLAFYLKRNIAALSCKSANNCNRRSNGKCYVYEIKYLIKKKLCRILHGIYEESLIIFEPRQLWHVLKLKIIFGCGIFAKYF